MPKPVTFDDLPDRVSFDDLPERMLPTSRMTAGQEGLITGLSAGYDDEIRAGITAPVRALRNVVTGEGEGGVVDRLSQGYEGQLRAIRRRKRENVEDYPVTSTIGEFGGAAIAGAVPAAKVMQAPSMLGRALRGGTAGTIYGTVAGYGSGEGVDDRMSQALTGGVFGGIAGAAGPPVAEAVGRVAQGAANLARRVRRARRVSATPSERVARAVAEDRDLGIEGLTDEQFAWAQRQGIPVANVDRGGTQTRSLARSSADRSQEALADLEPMLEDRFRSQADRFTGFLDRIAGAKGADAAVRRDMLKARSRQLNAPRYQAAYEAGDRGIWSRKLERLTGSDAVEDAMARAVKGGRDRAIADGFGGFNPRVNVTPDGRVTFQRSPQGNMIYPNLQYWDAVKQELDDMASSAYRQGNKKRGAVLSDLARQLRGELDRQVPEYAAARAGAQRFFGQEDALEAGEAFARQRVSRGQAEKAIKQMSPDERELFRQGFVSDLVNDLRRMADNRDVVRKFSNPDMRMKMRMALSPEEAAELEARIYVERIMQKSNEAVRGGSKTHRYFMTDLGIGMGSAGGAGLVSGDPATSLAVGVLSFAGRRGMRGMANRIDQARAAEVGRLLASGDPADITRGVQTIASDAAMMKALRDMLSGPLAVGGAAVAN